jgi:hypothetical protein
LVKSSTECAIVEFANHEVGNTHLLGAFTGNLIVRGDVDRDDACAGSLAM